MAITGRASCSSASIAAVATLAVPLTTRGRPIAIAAVATVPTARTATGGPVTIVGAITAVTPAGALT
jgi:hypothetical protein